MTKTQNKSQLRVYRSDIDRVIAESEVAAAAICRELYGEADWDDETTFEVVPDDEPLAFVFDDCDVPSTVTDNCKEPHPTWKGMTRVTLSASEWVQLIGRGFLASTEW